VTNSTTRYIYDGWRVIQERDTSNPLVSYTRGNDLSGSLEGAGGIGGLLARSHGYASTNGNWYTHNFYHADGNGNITYLVNNSQTLGASYRYDPFGNYISQSGSLAAANVYRFSSKEIHINSGMYYYGYRFYDPYLQRWLNRDLLGEPGFEGLRRRAPDLLGRGPNLYEFVSNTPLNMVDALGLEPMLPPGWHGFGTEYDPSSNPFEDPLPAPQWHKCRNRHQKCPQNEPKGDPSWKPDRFNWGNTDPKKGHVGNCYRGQKGGPIFGLGGAQCCYVNGKLNSSDEGTYDYISPGDSYWNPGTWGHIIVDVIPAIIWGN